ncbi:Ig-like domain-containing protein, partial [Mizugakiibacter sediminis]
MDVLARARGAAVALCISIVVFVAGATQLPEPALASSALSPEAVRKVSDLWVVDDHRLLRLPLSGVSAEPQVIATIDSPLALASDDLDGLVWVLQKRHLIAVDNVGATLADIDLSTQLAAIKTAQISVDAANERVWVATEKTLLLVDFDGRVLKRMEMQQAIRAFAFDEAQALAWVATGNRMIAYDMHGAIEHAWSLDTPAVAIAPDSGALWTTDAAAIRRYDEEGRLLLSASTGGVDPRHLTTDGAGGVWAVGLTAAEHVDAHGFLLQQVRPAAFGAARPDAQADTIVAAVVDRALGGVWLIGHRQVVRLGDDGLEHLWFDIQQWPQVHVIVQVAPHGRAEETTTTVREWQGSARSAQSATSVVAPEAQASTREAAPTSASAKAVPETPTDAACGVSGLACGKTAAVSQHEARALWVTARHDVYKIAPDTGVATDLDVLEHPRALAVDSQRDEVWAYRHHTLVAFDATGAQRVKVELPRGSEDDDQPVLAVDGASGVVWLGLGHTLHRFDRQGQRQASYPLNHEVRALALDTHRMWLWVAENRALVAYDATGGVQFSQALKRRPEAMTYDAKLDQLWLVFDHTLTRLKADGSVAVETRLDGDIEAIVSDGAGGLWAIGDRALAHFDGAAKLQFALRPFEAADGKGRSHSDDSGLLAQISQEWDGWWHGHGDDDKLVGLAADPLNHSVWVAGRRYLAQIAIDGQRRQQLDSRTWASMDTNARRQDDDDHGRHEGENDGIHQIALYVDTVPPAVTLTAPADGTYTNQNRPTLALHYADVGSGVDPASIAITSDGVAIAVACQAGDDGAQCTLINPLADGAHALGVTVKDYAGNASPAAIAHVTVDTVPPTITLSSPTTTLTNQASLELAGTLSEISSLTVNEAPVTVDGSQRFSLPIVLKEGSNTYTLLAIDRANNTTTKVVTITLDTVPPAQPNLGLIVVTGPDGGKVTITGKPGSVEAGSTIVLTDTLTGATVSVTAAADGSFSATLAAGASDPISVWIEDGAGNITKASATIEASHLPPDPATVAPKSLPTIAAQFQDQVGFLYSGPQPIQTGVAPGTIHPLHVAVARGAVRDRTNQPLAGVTITVLGHPEYGQTLTRADGQYDLAVNGGGSVVLSFAKQGYLTIQRTVDVAWHDFTIVDPLVMIAPDPVATSVTFGSDATQVAQGSVQVDDAGSRQATVLIPSGTTATAVMPDGTTKTVTAAHVRATEFTVGALGPSAMPAALPPTSAYTYAVDLSLDEAQAAGATTVQFSRPLPVYVNNFLGFAPGARVPAGYYDPQAGAWKGALDGVVVKLLGLDATGLAQLDLDGTGAPATALTLGMYGIDNAELAAIATTFTPGQSFWRIPVSHFTAWDFNLGYNPQAGYLMPPPAQPKPKSNMPQRDTRDNHDCSGCEIDAENQRVGETIPIVGTPYALHYESSSPTSLDERTLTFPVTTATPPAGVGSLLSSIAVTVDIAGRHVEQTFDPTLSGQSFNWTWDGLNAYGQRVYGPTPATIVVAYVYKASYGAFIGGTPGAGSHFGMPGNAVMTGFAHNGDRVAAARRWTEVLSPGVESPLGADRWSLNVVHAYDSFRHILYQGDGTIRSAQDYGEGGMATNFAGQGGNHIGAGGDGGPATQATLWDPAVVKVAPDGTVYIWDSAEGCIRKVDVAGIISTFAGKCGLVGNSSFSTTPISATSTRLRIDFMATAPDGSLYINAQNGMVRITPDGMGVLVAGGGTKPLVDGQSSMGMYINGLFVVSEDGSIYFSNGNNHYGVQGLWKIDPAGVLHFVLGGGFDYGIGGLAFANSGDVVFGDSTALLGEIKELTPQGRLLKLAGYGPNGGPHVSPNPTLGLGTYIPQTDGLARGPDGSIYQSGYGQIIRLDSRGWVSCVVGCSSIRYNGNPPFPAGGLPAQSVRESTCCQFNAFDVGPDGSIYLPELYDARVIRIAPALPQLSLGDVFVASEGGRQLYVFNPRGQHIKTLDAITGNSIYTFEYDASGLLASLTDAEGRTTTIARDANGKPLSITAPDGQTTTLGVDDHLHLTSVTDPAKHAYSMVYDTVSGQLTSFTDPRGNADQYVYDANGFLSKNVNAIGGGWTLARTGATDQSGDYTVAMTSAMGRTNTFAVSTRSDGSNLDLATAPDGTTSSLVITQGGQRITTAADGTVTTVTESADPRFGMQAPTAGNVTIKTPSGLTWSGGEARSVTLQTPSNLLSLSSLREIFTANGKTTTRDYDPVSRSWTTTSAAGRTATTTVDELDRPVKIAVAGVAPVAMAYDAAGRLLSASVSDGTATRTTTYAYYADGPAKGWLQSVTDPLGRTVSYQYDAAGRVTRKTLPDGAVIDFGYDANGNLTSLTPPGRPAHGFTYTPVDQTESYTPPAVADVGAPATQYQYNKDRQITQITRPDGAVVSFGYDAGGRLSTLTTPTGSYQYGYAAKTGQLSSILAPGNEALAYTWDGFLPTGVTWSGTITGSVTRSYDANFRVVSLAVNGQGVAYGYDDDGLLTAAGDLSVTRDAGNGRIIATAQGAVQTAQTYTGFGELATLTAANAGTSLYDVTYTRDAVGRITRREETVAGAHHAYDYTYDAQGRLADVKQDGVDLGAYGYDANGNRVSIGGQTVARYDDQDRLLAWGDATYTYTANGELASKTTAIGTTRYTYDVLGNLRGVRQPDGTDLQYVIDG